jgi:hypothetical protein
MGEQKYVLICIDPTLDGGYLTWPLPTDPATTVGVADVPGEKLYW